VKLCDFDVVKLQYCSQSRIIGTRMLVIQKAHTDSNPYGISFYTKRKLNPLSKV